MYVSGSTAYVGAGGLRVVDVSNPARPTEVGYHATLGQAHGVYVSGSTVYVADGSGGLLILSYLRLPSVTGRVLDESSNPIAGVRISAGAGYSAVTDASGMYVVSYLPMTGPRRMWSLS